ncbi:MAG: DNA-formamidopyrimidine glycosylase family protein [Actinomycetota bacterium]
MPEGDTIHRTANRLRSALAGRTLARFDLRQPSPGSALEGPAPGVLIEAVEAEGKYLLIRFGDGTVLETHMKMTGSWHLYRTGERWRRGRSSLRVLVATEEWEAVCFAAPHVRVYRPEGPGGRRRTLEGDRARLGPDLTSPDPDLDEVLRRLGGPGHGPRALVDVLLDQTLFCGVGNVYKSELLHHGRHHPLLPLHRVDDDGRRLLASTAHRLLRANLHTARRTTVPEGLAVYGRAGLPCRRCRTPVNEDLLGVHLRVTFWCEQCQPLPT